MTIRGGKRPGAGRKKGARTKRTQEIVAKAAAEGIQPLEYMMRVMRDPDADTKRRDAMAMAAAPFIHPKLAAITHSGDENKPLALTGITVEFVQATYTNTRRLPSPDDRTGGSSV